MDDIPTPRNIPTRVLWIGGAQWAGKSSVAQLLVTRHPLLLYAYDYHDARSHARRAREQPERYPHLHGWLTALERDPDEVWVRPSPEVMAESALRNFADRFRMVLDELTAMPGATPILAEGWGLRPDLIAPFIDSPRRAIFLVPTDEFLEQQMRTVPRAMGFNPETPVTDPERAQRNRLERNILLARNVVDSAGRLGLRVVIVDGSLGVTGLTDLVEEHFRPHLPRWLY